MKIILNEEVHGLGEPGKIVDVAPGYARNFLIPRKLAVYANKASVRELEHHRNRLERKRQRLVTAAMGIVERINKQSVKIEAHAGESGKLFGSVTTADIAKALQDNFEVTIERRKITLREPIRSLGNHEVDVQFLGDTSATVTVVVFDPNYVAPVVKAPPVVVAEEVIEAPVVAEVTEEVAEEVTAE